MKIHTDKITTDDLHRLAPAGCIIEARRVGSRSRAYGIDFLMVAVPGKDKHGGTRRYATGGAFGFTDGTHRAATWVEWGDFICDLFKIDPAAKIGNYEGQRDFIDITAEEGFRRDEYGQRKDMQHEAAAQRWADELCAVV